MFLEKTSYTGSNMASLSCFFKKSKDMHMPVNPLHLAGKVFFCEGGVNEVFVYDFF